ncbi:MAG: hypothetical protein ACYS8Z_21200, partial [Planctomycetota bacterium]
HWSWQEPMKLIGYRSRSPRLNRSMSAYLRPYIDRGEVAYCPNTLRKFKYLEEAWAAGDSWDNPDVDTPMGTEPLSGTYCFYWSYTGYLEGKRYLFDGPRTDAGGRGQNTLLVSDYFGYDYYESSNAYGSCEKFKGASLVSGTMLISGYWAGERGSTSPKPEMKLNAGYVDGHVESYSSSDTTTMLVIRKPESGEPYPDGIGPGKFFLPKNAFH